MMRRLRRLGRRAVKVTVPRLRRLPAAPARPISVLGAVVLLVAAVLANTGRQGTEFGPSTQLYSWRHAGSGCGRHSHRRSLGRSRRNPRARGS